ncbi:kinase-like protein [Tricholoma matsutake]|nr:kinase-like protein [Tricholoma matsutake 945]
MPPIRRSLHATRTRVDPLRRNNQDKPRIPRVQVDGLVHGWQFKAQYEGSDVPEFPREPNPGLLRPTNSRLPPLKLGDLECVRVLGGGAYGTVLLVQTSRDNPLHTPGRLFAMKTLRKKHIRFSERDDPTSKDVERSMLSELPWDPFVNGIIQTFHDSINLYLMLEFVPCGTLRSLIQKRAPFDPATALFYFANIVCALQYLEVYGIIHRDIKPENLLVGAEGYLCLADFGSAAKVFEKGGWIAHGTTAYMAPEVVASAGQSERIWSGIDWWSSGCVLYEMITRKMLFRGHTEKATFKKLLSGHYDWPPTVRVGKKVRSLVAGLLMVDAVHRLGAHGASEVMQHLCLKDVVWDRMLLRQYLAPYIPPTPRPCASWHRHPLPEQSKIPGLKIVEPPLHLVHDNRFPPLKDSEL